jgi:signal transduction histidine kinase
MSPLSDIVDSTQTVPMPRLVNFVRQVTHDVRNGLNAIDLQAAFVAEIAPPGEFADEIGKLRGMVNHVTRDMQELSARFAELRPVLMSYPVHEFMMGLKEAVEEEFDTQAKRLVWEVKAGEVEMEMDYTLLTQALMELVRNAIYFREGDDAIHFTVWNDRGNVVFEVRQKKAPLTGVDDWGRLPLTSGRRGGYGLGLFYVRRILDTLGGELEPDYDGQSGELRVRLTLPLIGARTPGTQKSG